VEENVRGRILSDLVEEVVTSKKHFKHICLAQSEVLLLCGAHMTGKKRWTWRKTTANWVFRIGE
jgi:hypothetical protein